MEPKPLGDLLIRIASADARLFGVIYPAKLAEYRKMVWLSIIPRVVHGARVIAMGKLQQLDGSGNSEVILLADNY